MPAPLTIVIPTLNAASGIAPTLNCLVPSVTAGLVRELIISDGGSDDDIAQIADELGAVFVTGASGRGSQLRAGADVAQAPWIMFLHADTVLSDNWVDAVWAHIENYSTAGYGRLAFDGGGFMARLISGGANMRSRVFGMPYGDQGLLISRNLYDHVGGFKDIPLMEDVAMARALRGRMRRLGFTATTSPERYKRQGWIRRPMRNLGLLLRYLCGADPKKLASEYSSRQKT
jgi:rSAM/selenodomain-associated transferase 2